jgi:hypothetical protein
MRERVKKRGGEGENKRNIVRDKKIINKVYSVC